MRNENRSEKTVRASKTRGSLILAPVLMLVLVCFAGCGDAGSVGVIGGEDQTEGPAINVTMSIDYPDEVEIEDIEDFALSLPEGSTVLDALEAMKEEADLLVAVEKGTFTNVTNLGGLSEYDLGDSCGWVFEINDEMVMENIASFVLSEGDSIEWEYVNWDEVQM